MSERKTYGRYEALRRRNLRLAWVALAISLLIPVLALGVAYAGWTYRRRAPREGWALAVLGAAVFVVRYGVYAFN
jgi:hypothetical protein